MGSTPTAPLPLASLWSHGLHRQAEVLALLPLGSTLLSVPAHLRLFAPGCEVFLLVGECVWVSVYQPAQPASPASQRSGACSGFSVSVMFRELSESSGSECLGSMTPETQDIYLRMDHHRRRSGYRLGRIIARQQLLKRIAGGRRRDSF